jgi:hypothetical protein
MSNSLSLGKFIFKFFVQILVNIPIALVCGILIGVPVGWILLFIWPKFDGFYMMATVGWMIIMCFIIASGLTIRRLSKEWGNK